MLIACSSRQLFAYPNDADVGDNVEGVSIRDVGVRRFDVHAVDVAYTNVHFRSESCLLTVNKHERTDRKLHL